MATMVILQVEEAGGPKHRVVQGGWVVEPTVGVIPLVEVNQLHTQAVAAVLQEMVKITMGVMVVPVSSSSLTSLVPPSPLP